MSPNDTHSALGMPAEDYSHLSARGQALVSRFRGLVASRVKAGQPARVLEVGCGQGWLLAEVARAVPGARLSGIDIRPEAIDYARSVVPSAQLGVADATVLPFADDSFDVVVCSEVLEHVGDPRIVAEEIRRVGAGHAVISVPYEPWFWAANLVRGKYLSTLGNCPGHIHHFTRARFRRLLSRSYSEVEVLVSFPWLVADVRWE